MSDNKKIHKCQKLMPLGHIFNISATLPPMPDIPMCMDTLIKIKIAILVKLPFDKEKL